jgi:hypothetical protein
MKRLTMVLVMLAGALLAAGCTTGRYAQYDKRHAAVSDTLSTMKKQDVISLTKAGVSDSLIVSMLDVTGSWFDLKTQDVIDLKNAGVSDKVVNAMIGANAPPAETKDADRPAYAYYYPPYYWYAGYDPFWYSPSWYFGFNYYHPMVIHRYVYPHRTYFGNYGYRTWGRPAGRRR